ncbi:DNA damage-binding protein 2 isoform X1 [Echinops telfairi]|uniref:DNA damage-binding protein 2 isoform X1 n=2 Tax=Echinops telfairi TaxID=9371 RepID=A0AC55D5C8_ECHTE|nr:DNA damage-binding protein 2 isoform X1 [Echinops telfairi]XP_045146953.1 DNA damage-binding protein 2 isoform X1 [Echinops telfairi]
MAPRKRPDAPKTPEVAARLRGKRSRSPPELEPENKQLSVQSADPDGRSDSGCLGTGAANPKAQFLHCSIVRALQRQKLGKAACPTLPQSLQWWFLDTLPTYRISQKAIPFDRRATSMAWHPTHPSTLAVGSKGGDILLWNFRSTDTPTFIKGIGAGGVITGLKFNPLNTNQFFTSSMEGTTRLQDFKGTTLRILASSNNCNVWFCSLDVSASSRMVVTGDNAGQVILLNMDGQELWNLRLHKKKVTHVALNPLCDWLLATASVDQSVKIWDLRQVKGNSSFLSSLPHKHPVNAACFSPDGNRLLTTDQNSEIRVYSTTRWDRALCVIPHPHRQFQHLTPIQAAWHTRHNLIAVGRYPDPNFKSYSPYELRTVDVLDGSSGKLMCQLYDQGYSGIISRNEFSPMGDTLASMMGYHILIWSQVEAGTQKQEKPANKRARQGLRSSTGNASEKRRLSLKGLKVYKS